MSSNNHPQGVFLSQKREREEDSQKKQNDSNKLKEELRSLLNSNITQLTQTSQASINALKNVKAPKPDQFSISHPNIPGVDMDTIKLTAQYIARNGQKFLSELSERESKNAQFNFLKPQHYLFGYFTFLVGSYSKILSDKKEKIKKLVQYSSSTEIILSEANNRVLYEKKLKRLQKNKKFNEEDLLTEEEKKKNRLIDWYDFVVVDTIDFEETNSLQNDNLDNNQELADNIENVDNTEQKPEEKEEPSVPVQKEEAPITNQKETQKDTQKEKEEPPKEVPKESYLTQKGGIKIVKNYTRQARKSKKDSDNQQEIKCPLCKMSISEEKFQEHLKQELLDPKWKEIQKEISQRSENSTLVDTPEFLSYLGDFSKSRPDLFGDINDIQDFEQKKNETKAKDHQIWSGYNPFMSRTTANITMFKQQNKKHLEESKKAAMANNANNNQEQK